MSSTATVPARWMPLDARLGSGVWAINQPGPLNSNDYEGITLLRTGLDHRHDRQLLGRFAGQAAPRRTAVLGRFRVQRRAMGDALSVMQRCSKHGGWPWSLRGKVGRM